MSDGGAKFPLCCLLTVPHGEANPHAAFYCELALVQTYIHFPLGFPGALVWEEFIKKNFTRGLACIDHKEWSRVLLAAPLVLDS